MWFSVDFDSILWNVIFVNLGVVIDCRMFDWFLRLGSVVVFVFLIFCFC